MTIIRKMLVATLAIVCAGSLQAEPIVLDFEGVGDLAAIEDFYNGGTDSQGNSGTDFGIEFSGNTLGIIDEDAGGSGNFANEPSPDTIMFWLDANSAIMNVAAGFDTGFSFFYSSSTEAIINVWSGLGGTGNLLGSINLFAQFSDNCTGDPSGDFCNWTAAGVSFEGVARSIDFGGTANFTGYDDVTFGSSTPGGATPVPEPGTLVLLGAGLLCVGLSRRRRAA